MTTHRHNRTLNHPLIGKVCTITAALALLLTLGTIPSTETVHAFEYPPSYDGLNKDYNPDSRINVHSSTAGGADVTPLSTKTLPNGDVTYKFQVSLLGLHSSGHIQSADIFQIAMPAFVKDVKFSQYGTYPYSSDAIPHAYYSNSSEYRYRDYSPASNVLKSHVDSYIDEDAPGKPTVTAEMPLEIIKASNRKELTEKFKKAKTQRTEAVAAYYKKHADRLRKESGIPAEMYDPQLEQQNDTFGFRQTVTLNGMKALREAGYKEIPGGIFDAGYDYGKFDSTVKTGDEIAELEKTNAGVPKVKSYIISVGYDMRPMALHVEYTISADQVKKTPTMPLWASLAWRTWSEGGGSPLIPSPEWSMISLNNIGDTLTSFKAIANPETIQNNEFDKNGLYGTNVGVTSYTGNWYTIGADITHGTFSYINIFSLSSNPGVGYDIPMADDHRDIAALNPNKPLPPGRPKARIPENGQFIFYVGRPNVIASGGGVDVSPILEPLAKEPFPKAEAQPSAEHPAKTPDKPECIKPEDMSTTTETQESTESPDKAGTRAEDTVHYSFLVSLQSVHDRHVANTFDIQLPFEAKDIELHQIGTYDTSKNDPIGDYAQNLKIAHYAKFPLETMKVDEDHDAYAKLKEEYHKRAQILQKYYQAQGKTLTDEDALSKVKQLGMLATQEELTALKAAGVKKLPGGIYDAGISTRYLSGRPNYKPYPQPDAPDAALIEKYSDKSHSFVISVSNALMPLAVQVDFNVSKKQAEKTPYMAVWAGLAWRGGSSNDPSFIDPDAQSWYEYPSIDQDRAYLSNPELINPDQFDENGLYGTTTALNRYTGKWWEIGNDITQGLVNYGIVYNTGIYRERISFASPYDDYRDIAAMHYLEPKPAIPPRKNSDGEPKLCPPAPVPPVPGGGEVTPPAPAPTPAPAPKADEPSSNPSPETPDNTGLPRTGVNLAFGGGLAAALLVAGVMLISRRRKNLN